MTPDRESEGSTLWRGEMPTRENPVEKLTYSHINTKGNDVVVTGDMDDNSQVEILLDGPSESLPLLLALSLAAVDNSASINCFAVNIFREGVNYYPAWGSLGWEQQKIRGILLANPLLGVNMEVLDHLSTMVAGFIDDRNISREKGGRDKDRPSNWVGLNPGEAAFVDGLSLSTDLIALGLATKSGNTENISIIQRARNQDEVTLTHSAWGILLTDATSRHLPGETIIVAPVTITENTKKEGVLVRRYAKLTVADLRRISQKVIKIISKNDYARDGLKFWPDKLGELYSQIDPYQTSNGLKALRPALEIPTIVDSIPLSDHSEVKFLKPATPPKSTKVLESKPTISTDQKAKPIEEKTTPPPAPKQKEIVPEKPLPAEKPATYFKPISRSVEKTAHVEPESNPKVKNLREKLTGLRSGDFSLEITKDSVPEELGLLMKDLADKLGGAKLDVSWSTDPVGWKMSGSMQKKYMSMILTPDQNSGFGIGQLKLDGFGFIEQGAVKLLLNPGTIISELNKNLPKFTPGINVAKLIINRDGSLVISGTKK